MKSSSLDQFLIDDTAKIKISEPLWGSTKSTFGIILFVVFALILFDYITKSIITSGALFIFWILSAYIGFSRQVFEIDVAGGVVKDYVRSFGIIKSKGEIIRLEDYPNISLLQTNVMKGRARGIMQPVGFAGNEVALIQYQITLLSPDHRRKHVIERIIEDPEKAKKRVEAWSEKLDLPVVKYSPPRVARRRR